MSRRPKLATASVTIASRSPGFVTSTLWKRAVSGPPSDCAAAIPAATSVSPITTRAPSSMKRAAMPRPMPRAAPISTAARPSSLPAIRSLLGFVRSRDAHPDLVLDGIEHHGQQHEAAMDDLREMGWHAHEIDRRVDGRKQQHAGIDARKRPDAALEAHAADHHGGESLEQHADAQIGGRA